MFNRVISNNLWQPEAFEDGPKPFKSTFIDPTAQETSAAEKGKWIGVGFAICVGIIVVVAIVIVFINRAAKNPRQRHAESGAEGTYYEAGAHQP